MAWYNRSLERHTAWHCGLTLVLLTALCLGISLYWPHWWIWLGSLIALGLGNRLLWAGRQQQLAAFRRASIQLDALKLQDYSLQAKPAYSQGVVAECQQQLQQLSAQLQQRKSFFDEQQFLLYQLIDQLNTPILVLNHKQQLSYANADFQHLFGQPWQSLRHCSAASLGLTDQPQWQFVANPLSQQWQIRHSRFLDQGDRYQLLVFIDIQSALRESQLQAWQHAYPGTEP
ncbi:hypothetical protein KJI95_19250 [Shewanella sp. JM162201]|uniref:PAS domain-containing protein n=1 Tax=Shewanella jiangmenensis TaxID=2837387 RepID=A0ABS5VC74_9GAMM|nr:hypothetical protein [Shewanella jiangmenensis]MBT1446638.1 hypothetical protein [Shewanella jiangmenensis]